MLTFDTNDLPVQEMHDPADGALRFKFDFPVYAAKGSADCAVVYMEIEPGKNLGMHTDSEEEIVLVLGGTAEGTVGDEIGKLEEGAAVVIPAMVPHDFRNIGESVLRAIGFFSGATVISTFEPAPFPDAQAMVVYHDRNGERMLAGAELAE